MNIKLFFFAIATTCLFNSFVISCDCSEAMKDAVDCLNNHPSCDFDDFGSCDECSMEYDNLFTCSSTTQPPTTIMESSRYNAILNPCHVPQVWAEKCIQSAGCTGHCRDSTNCAMCLEEFATLHDCQERKNILPAEDGCSDYVSCHSCPTIQQPTTLMPSNTQDLLLPLSKDDDGKPSITQDLLPPLTKEDDGMPSNTQDLLPPLSKEDDGVLTTLRASNAVRYHGRNVFLLLPGIAFSIFHALT